MKALRYYGNRDIRLEDMPRPEPGFGEVRIKVTDAGLCQTQINEFIEGPYIINSDPSPLTGHAIPLIAGHEFGGTVEAVGGGVDVALVGEQMAVLPLLSCGKCEWCRRGHPNLCDSFAYYGLTGADGGFAEYAVVHEDNLFPVANVNLLTFIEPLLVALHSCHKVVHRLANSRVLVVGAGAIGIAVAAVLRDIHGAEVFVTDVLERRLVRAKKAGLPTLPKAGITQRFDIVFECAGSDHFAAGQVAFLESLTYLRKMGFLIMLGSYFHALEIQPVIPLLNEFQLIGSFAYGPADVVQLRKVIDDLKLDFSHFIDTILLEEIIEQGYFKGEVDKAGFTRLVVKC